MILENNIDSYIMTTVDISGINKLELLETLWKRSNTETVFQQMVMNEPEFDRISALKDAELRNWSIDYLQGKLIKSNLSRDKVNPVGYDFDNGYGAFQECVDAVRS